MKKKKDEVKDVVIKRKHFYVNGKPCMVELKKSADGFFIVEVDGEEHKKTANELFAVQLFNAI